MSDVPSYPKDYQVKVEWTKLHIFIVILSVIVIWTLFYYCTINLSNNLTNKLLSVAGLNIDIIGVVVASLKTPYYGAFHDGGRIETIRANAERKYFQIVMWLIALGFFLQALVTLL